MTETTNISKDKSKTRLCTVTLALRSTGVVEIYYDFEFVQTINLNQRKRPRFCYDIQCDRGTFYLKCLKLNCQEVADAKNKNLTAKVKVPDICACDKKIDLAKLFDE